MFWVLCHLGVYIGSSRDSWSYKTQPYVTIPIIGTKQLNYLRMGLLPDKSNCGLRMRRECRERFPHHRGLAIPTCIMPGSLTCGFLRSRWRGKRSRHARSMRNPQCFVSGKRPMEYIHWRCIRYGGLMMHVVMDVVSHGNLLFLGSTQPLLGSISWFSYSGMNGI